MRIDLLDEKGSTGVFIELPVEQLMAGLGSPGSSPESEVQLKESQAKVVELEEKLRAPGRTMDDFTPIEKANFVIAWGKGLSTEDKNIFGREVGITLTEAKVAEVAEGPATIPGETDKPGYKYLESLDLSVRE